MNQENLFTIMLSWNRPYLLVRTIRSYFENTRSAHRLAVVDNASNEETRLTLKALSGQFGFEVLYLNENKGGRAFNILLDRVDKQWVHFSENDLEYRPGWDEILIGKLSAFPEIGQISPFSPFPEKAIGEIAGTKPATLHTKEGQSVYLTAINVGTTCIVRPELIRQGIKWKNYSHNGVHFPSDGHFSYDVKRLGWKVAWNDRHVVTNWGHNLAEFQRELDYYVQNYKSKEFVGLKGWDKRMRKHGYKLSQVDGSYRIEPVGDDDRTV